MSGEVRIERPENAIVVMTMDCPSMNPLDSVMRRLLLDALDAVDADMNARVVILTGAGASFCAGEDLKEDPETSAAGTSFMTLLERLETMRLPVIAAINGWCIGGGFELAVNCDLRIASDTARFVCAGVNVGLMASAYRLPRLIGVSRAKAMLLTGSQFDAATMQEFGFLTGVFPPEDLSRRAMDLARQIASRAPLSVEATKQVADQAPDMAADEASHIVHAHLTRLRQSDDHKEAVEAFREKRAPHFKRT